MKRRDYLDYFEDIIGAINALEDFVKDVDFDRFKQDRKIIFASIRCFEVIGEASKNIKGTIRTRYPDIPWQDMAATRDKLIHAYFGIDTKVLWDTIQKDIPNLKIAVSRAFNELKREKEN
jgi:uncharacterized protein with HEPN domain